MSGLGGVTLTVVGSDSAIASLEPSLRAALGEISDTQPDITAMHINELSGKNPQLVVTGSSISTEWGIIATVGDIINYVRGKTQQQTPVIVLHLHGGDAPVKHHDAEGVELTNILSIEFAIRSVLNLPLA